ncbi:unnamed protein product [Phyllotreta striolata]|uniref:Acaloleptin A-like n=1 Tax=Phyllotreta striolata TaxID=444603 RepID=A0A9N9TGD6_PHYSR|nr:unnamed protein product [Phyllotreta striolata]
MSLYQIFYIALLAFVLVECKKHRKNPWEVNPGVGRDQNGNTNAGVEIKRQGENGHFEAGWNKVVHGPNKAKPTWHVGGTFRFKRSPEGPWEVNPGVGRDQNGNTNAGVEIKRQGENGHFEAGWNKVVRGPNKAKPTWHVGGSFRFKRSPDGQWEVQPGAGTDQNGNTNAGVEIKRQGENGHVEAGWNKVVHGPNKAKPTWHVGGTFRFKRSPEGPWEVNPGVGRDQNGNTNAGVEIKRQGENGHFEAGWNKVVRGPNKAKPTWHVGGSFRFKRSPDGQWEIQPGAGNDQNGNTNAGVEIKRKGENGHFEAGWNKVVHGPNKAKPTWHVGGTFRFKRSPEGPWEVNPGVGRDQNGNTNAGVEIKRQGENGHFEAGWNKVVHGPNKAKPTWHVGGTFRFKRSPEGPWEVNPGVGRDQNGNTNAGVEIKRQGENGHFEAGWNKVVRGPNKAKPTWHVGGSFRFKRSPDGQWEVHPGAGTDQNGNTNAGVEVKRHGENGDFEAGWNKVVHGPNKSKPTWHVGGTIKF